MALENIYPITVNTKKKMFREIPEIVANDNVVFEITIYDDAVLFPFISGYTAKFVSLKLSGKSVIRDATITNGIVRVVLGSSEMLEPGKVEGTVQIFDANLKRISTAKFDYVVKKDPSLQGGLPTDDKTLVIANEQVMLDAIDRSNLAMSRLDTQLTAVTILDETKDIRVRTDGSQAPSAGAYVRELASNLANNANKLASLTVNVKYPPSGYVAAKGDGSTDDTAALQALINYCTTNKKRLYLPFGFYKTTAPLTVPMTQGFYMCGDGNRNTVIDPHHNGYAIDMASYGQSYVFKDFSINPQDSTYRYAYDGIRIKDSLLCTIDNVYLFYPKNGYVLEGATYVCTTKLLYIYMFSEKGVFFKKNANGDGPNGNRISIQFLRGISQSTANSYGVYIERGSVNTFTDGQISDCDTTIYQADGYRNYFEKFWLEHTNTSINILSGSAYVNCHGAFLNKVADGAIMYNTSGQSTPYLDLTRDMPKEDKNLKGLWFFNEGSGSRVLDKSGNKKHATLNGTPTWTTDGTWGTAAYFKYSDGRSVSVPVDVVDWSQPYTYMINYSLVTGADSPAVGLYMYDSVTGNYFAGGQTKTSLMALSYMGGVVENPSWKPTGRSGQPVTGKNIYAFVYVDPVNKTIEVLDPFANANPKLQMSNSFVITNPTMVHISGRAHVTNTNEGNISMAAFWQRKLSNNEVIDIVNNPSRPLSQFDKRVVNSTTYVSPNGTSYQLTVSDAGQPVVTQV